LMNNSTSEFPLGPVYGINFKGVNPNGDIFVGGSYEYRSIDDGDSWQEIRMESQNPSDPPVLAFTALTIGTTGTCNLFIATGASGLYVSENGGTIWRDEGNLSDSTYPFPTYVAASSWGSIFEVGPYEIERGIGMDGQSFDSIANAPPFKTGIKMASNATGLIVAGGTGGLFFTLDTGNYWAPITPSWATTNTDYVLAVDGNGDVFVGTNSIDGRQGGISVSKDTGRSWQDISSGLITDTINALTFNNNGELFAATDNGVFKYNPSGSGVKTTTSDAPASLTLEQNTPNPFASSTNIQFSVPESGPVSLRVFDPTGREVGTVVSGSYSPGTYTTSFNADGLPDGAYYYRLESDGQTAARMFVVEH
jgi:Secretion system C-terminal sorting domain